MTLRRFSNMSREKFRSAWNGPKREMITLYITLGSGWRAGELRPMQSASKFGRAVPLRFPGELNDLWLVSAYGISR
jgi:hypothetical protein